MANKIMQVDQVEFDSHSVVGQTKVLARGKVNTGGWTDIKLVPTVMDPKDRFIDLDFVGTPPSGPAPQVITEVKASLLVEVGGNLGVTVHATNNEIQKLFN